MSPDGIADAKTLQALTLARAPLGRFHDWSLAHNTRVQFILSTMGYIPNYETPLPPSSFKMSQAGKEMLFYNEATYGKDTACLHYPGNPSDPFNQSGVTLGPGYDMGEREKETIHDDLVSIGIDELTASKVAKDVPKLYGDDASKYALKYGKSSQEPLIQLSNKQQIMLQDKYLPPYEKLVKKLVVVPLLQREFDALVSFVVDPIRSFTEVSNHLNRDEVSAALTTILDRVPSRKSSIALGLMNRRQREVEFFVSGRYNK